MLVCVCVCGGEGTGCLEIEGTNVSSILQGLGASRLQGGTVSLKSLLLSGQLLSTGLLLLSVDPS